MATIVIVLWLRFRTVCWRRRASLFSLLLPVMELLLLVLLLLLISFLCRRSLANVKALFVLLLLLTLSLFVLLLLRLSLLVLLWLILLLRSECTVAALAIFLPFARPTWRTREVACRLLLIVVVRRILQWLRILVYANSRLCRLIRRRRIIVRHLLRLLLLLVLLLLILLILLLLVKCTEARLLRLIRRVGSIPRRWRLLRHARTLWLVRCTWIRRWPFGLHVHMLLLLLECRTTRHDRNPRPDHRTINYLRWRMERCGTASTYYTRTPGLRIDATRDWSRDDGLFIYANDVSVHRTSIHKRIARNYGNAIIHTLIHIRDPRNIRGA